MINPGDQEIPNLDSHLLEALGCVGPRNRGVDNENLTPAATHQVPVNASSQSAISKSNGVA